MSPASRFLLMRSASEGRGTRLRLRRGQNGRLYAFRLCLTPVNGYAATPPSVRLCRKHEIHPVLLRASAVGSCFWVTVEETEQRGRGITGQNGRLYALRLCLTPVNGYAATPPSVRLCRKHEIHPVLLRVSAVGSCFWVTGEETGQRGRGITENPVLPDCRMIEFRKREKNEKRIYRLSVILMTDGV